MKIACVADDHVANHRLHGGVVRSGLNDRCREILAVLRESYLRAQELGANAFFVLGDLFDTDHPTPQIIAATRSALTGNLPVYVLLGNHDATSNALGDHALGPLDGVGLIETIESPKVIDDYSTPIFCLPFDPRAAADWLPQKIVELTKIGASLPIVLVHVGIITSDTAPWLLSAKNALRVEDFGEGAGWVFAGDWHRRKIVGNVMQVGALVPTGYDNPGFDGYGTLALWEDGVTSYEVLPGPRFVKVASSEEASEAIVKARESGCRLSLSAVGDFTVNKDDVCVAVDREVDTTEANTLARWAAHVARESKTLEESLDGYIKAMFLPDDVSAESVSAKCRELLKL